MNIELAEEEPEVKVTEKFQLPEDFRLIDESKIFNGTCTVPKELFEKWVPPKPPKELNWIVQEILDDVKMEAVVPDITNTDILNENNQNPNELVVREFTMTALTQETEEDIYNAIYPIIDDPFIMGRVACTGLLNKLFAMRLFSCDRTVIILSLCDEWSQSVRDCVEESTVNGFKEIASEANIEINQVEIHNDNSYMIGGVMTVTHRSTGGQLGFPNISCIGDVIVLTKPLGVQMALNAYKIFQEEHNEAKDRLNRIISAEDLKKAYDTAIFLLTSLNLQAVKLTQGFEVHAATEINGHSLMEHSQMLAEQQLHEVAFFIYNLPLIGKMLHVSKALGNQADLILGNIPEICGGLLLVMPREHAANYCRKMLNEGQHAWIVGMVEKGRRSSNMIKKARIIEWNRNTVPTA